MTNTSARIIQLTTVHPRDDIRIAVKQCATLAAAFPNDVELVVADGLGAGEYRGIPITDLGSISSSRLSRPFKGFVRAVKLLWLRRPHILHFHDPELIPVGFVAKAMGIRVIYDVHEDVPSQLKGRKSIGTIARYALAYCANATEWMAGWILDAFVCATPSISLRFPARKTTLVQNYPIVAELATDNEIPYRDRPNRFVYIGGITEQRGAREMVEASAINGSSSDFELCLAGRWRPESLQQEVEETGTATNTTYLGSLDRAQVAQLLGSARAGLVLFHAAPNHVNAQPNKLFEYMSAGLPVIASDFPLWRQLVEDTQSGLLVDPTKPEAIRNIMNWITDNPEQAEAMGNRGRQAVESSLNWEFEARKLVSLYHRIFGASAR